MSTVLFLLLEKCAKCLENRTKMEKKGDEVVNGAGALPRVLPEKLDTDPPSRDSHEGPEQSVRAELEIVKRGVVQQMKEMETRFHGVFIF